MLRRLKRLARESRGTVSIEYALVGFVIALAGVVALATMGGSLVSILDSVTDGVEAGQSGEGGGKGSGGGSGSGSGGGSGNGNAGGNGNGPGGGNNGNGQGNSGNNGNGNGNGGGKP